MHRYTLAPYRPSEIFTHTPGYEWPGDYEGRMLLALSRLAEVQAAEHPLLGFMARHWDAHVPRHGHFGPRAPAGEADEQQLSSHGWVLRGMVAAARATGDSRWLDRAERVIAALTTGLLPLIDRYPVGDAGRGAAGGSYVGHLAESREGWQLSSDVGCVFIFLDGLTAHFAERPEPEVRELILAMTDRFARIDPVAVRAQTHATLTACRALLRAAPLLGRPDLIGLVEHRFAAYLASGSTATGQNQNWFGRPSWTEPCAIVDALIVASELHRLTGKDAWIHEARLIWHTGLGHAQRRNGGFGCDTCCGPAGRHLAVSIAEAPWCCTMRGADALAFVTERTLSARHGAIEACFFESVRSTLDLPGGPAVVDLDAASARDGRVVLSFAAGTTPQRAKVRVLLDPGVPRASVRVAGRSGDLECSGGWLEVEADARPGVRLEVAWSPRVTVETWPRVGLRDPVQRARMGPWVLGTFACAAGSGGAGGATDFGSLTPIRGGRAVDATGDVLYGPLDDMIDRATPDASYRRRVLAGDAGRRSTR